jgi:hypothetical protein
MSADAACPICHAPGLRGSLALPGLTVRRCPACGHRTAEHAPGGVEEDYHAQYAQGSFLDALRATRVRQAELLLSALQRRLPGCDRLLDYGAGRGWFLAACRERGLTEIAGADTSDLAVEGLRAAGIEAHRLLGETGPGGELARGLSFQPRVVTLLDVVEHFPPDLLRPHLRALLAEAGGSLELLVIKVPVPGLLYHTTRALSALGLHGPIRQLYQMGTWPPHFSYFSRRSLAALLDSLGFTVVEEIGDRDFEPALLAERTGLGKGLLRVPVRIAAGALAAAVRASGRWDTVIALAAPR